MDKRAIARDLFLNSSMTAKDIAERLNVAESTIGAWRAKEDWDEVRNEMRSVSTMRINIVLNLYRHLNTISKEIKDSDQIAKVVSAINSLERKTPLAHFQEVGQKFLQHVYERKPEHAAVAEELYTSFIIELTGGEEIDNA